MKPRRFSIAGRLFLAGAASDAFDFASAILSGHLRMPLELHVLVVECGAEGGQCRASHTMTATQASMTTPTTTTPATTPTLPSC